MITLLIISAIGGVISCLTTWTKMTFLGDSTSHASILGLSLPVIITSINHDIGLLIFYIIIVAITFVYIKNKGTNNLSNFLQILSYMMLSAGLFIFALTKKFTTHDEHDFIHYFIGNYENTANNVTYWIIAIVILTALFVYKTKNSIIIFLASEEMCKEKDDIIFFILCLTYLFVITSVKVIGIFPTILLILMPFILTDFVKNPLIQLSLTSVVSVFLMVLATMTHNKLGIPITSIFGILVSLVFVFKLILL